jgi:carbon starvation protein
MFGVANQLLAAIAFGVGTIIIVKSGKLKYAWVTFIPMVFMFTTTLTAAWKLIWLFMNKAASALSPAEALTFKIDAYLVFLMALLAVIVLFDMLFKFFRFVSEGTEMAKRGV